MLMDLRIQPKVSGTFMQLNPFAYEPLNSDRDQIRLLQIHYRAPSTDAIAATLRTVNLKDQSTRYQALSYTWGSPKDVRSIHLNDRTSHVHKNLYSFLAAASRDQKFCNSNYIWINQICIDQANMVEKAGQVARMAEVYECADEVIVWLGQGFLGSDELIRYIDMSPSNTSMQMRPQLFGHWVQLVELPYWSRLWIVQEVVLAKIITLWLGQARVVWGQFQHHAVENELLYTIRKYPGAELGAGRLQQLVEQRNTVTHGETRHGLNWSQALAVQKGSQCLMSHAKIYGLLGLVRENLRIIPDYSLPMEEVYYQVIDVHLKDTMSRAPNLDWTPWLNSVVWFAKELRFEMDLVTSISDATLSTCLTRKILQENSRRYLQRESRGFLKYKWTGAAIDHAG